MQETGKQVKCPNCGGVMEFDPASQKMKCPYCDTEMEVAEFQRKGSQRQNNKKKHSKKESFVL